MLKFIKSESKESKDMKLFSQMLEKNYENLILLDEMDKVEYVVDVSKVGSSFGISDNIAVTNNLKDGRSFSFWAELAVIEYYGLQGSPNKNSLFDATATLTKNYMVSSLTIGIKSLTKGGLDLQQSGFKGRGFKGLSKDDKMHALCTSVALCDYHIITDIVDAPTVYFLPISTRHILLHASSGNLPLIIKRDQFYEIFFRKTLTELKKDGSFYVWKV